MIAHARQSFVTASPLPLRRERRVLACKRKDQQPCQYSCDLYSQGSVRAHAWYDTHLCNQAGQSEHIGAWMHGVLRVLRFLKALAGGTLRNHAEYSQKPTLEHTLSSPHLTCVRFAYSNVVL
jgi:hypothetical protein